MQALFERQGSKNHEAMSEGSSRSLASTRSGTHTVEASDSTNSYSRPGKAPLTTRQDPSHMTSNLSVESSDSNSDQHHTTQPMLPATSNATKRAVSEPSVHPFSGNRGISGAVRATPSDQLDSDRSDLSEVSTGCSADGHHFGRYQDHFQADSEGYYSGDELETTTPVVASITVAASQHPRTHNSIQHASKQQHLTANSAQSALTQHNELPSYEHDSQEQHHIMNSLAPAAGVGKLANKLSNRPTSAARSHGKAQENAHTKGNTAHGKGPQTAHAVMSPSSHSMVDTKPAHKAAAAASSAAGAHLSRSVQQRVAGGSSVVGKGSSTHHQVDEVDDILEALNGGRQAAKQAGQQQPQAPAAAEHHASRDADIPHHLSSTTNMQTHNRQQQQHSMAEGRADAGHDHSRVLKDAQHSVSPLGHGSM